MGRLSVVASIGALSFGIVQAQTGYTDVSMAFQAGFYLDVVWLIAVAVFLYRHPEHVAGAEMEVAEEGQRIVA